ncbi:hypothetical protein SDC9_102706 [bioreactor metagenome]|uniref:Uncharacterized protein n=1 Tax=bioreactor metagenome TaxID=1076179 RepID=A0A645AT13_9ZZZZ
MEYKNRPAKKPNHHCILVVKSNNVQLILDGLLSRRAQRMKIFDSKSPESKTANKLKKKLGFPVHKDPYRYTGILSSEGFIKGDNIFNHIDWIFSNFKPDFNTNEWEHSGMYYQLSFAWWGGLGTGYGPKISSELARKLTKYNIDLEISIY